MFYISGFTFLIALFLLLKSIGPIMLIAGITIVSLVLFVLCWEFWFIAISPLELKIKRCKKDSLQNDENTKDIKQQLKKYNKINKVLFFENIDLNEE